GVKKRSGHPEAYGIRAYRFRSRRRHRHFLQELFQSVSQLSPAVRRPGIEERQEGQGPTRVQVVCHTVGNPAPTAQRGSLPEGRSYRRTAGADRRSRQEHRSCTEDAGSKTEAIRRLCREENRVNKNGCGNAGLWTARKTRNRFPSLSTCPWKSLPRFPHSRSPDYYRGGKVEIQKQDSRFPT